MLGIPWFQQGPESNVIKDLYAWNQLNTRAPRIPAFRYPSNLNNGFVQKPEQVKNQESRIPDFGIHSE